MISNLYFKCHYIFSDVPQNIRDLVESNSSLEIEQLHNIYKSINEPHCSICTMFSRNKVINIILNYLLHI